MIRRSLIVATLILLVAVPAFANHAWGTYHWARTSNPFSIKIIDSNTANWDDNLSAANADWNQSTVMNNIIEAGSDAGNTRKRCPKVSGKVRSCNATYGYNGWLGLATISISGGHISSGTSKMNDSYLASSSYSETNRQHVMCQEIGHTFGLGHQSESGADLNTCMDYSNDLGNPKPNAHDYSMLESIYSHVDGTTTIASIFDVSTMSASRPQTIGEILNDAGQWGVPVRFDAQGRPNQFIMPTHADGFDLTEVFWVPSSFQTDEPGDRDDIDRSK